MHAPSLDEAPGRPSERARGAIQPLRIERARTLVARQPAGAINEVHPVRRTAIVRVDGASQSDQNSGDGGHEVRLGWAAFRRSAERHTVKGWSGNGIPGAADPNAPSERRHTDSRLALTCLSSGREPSRKASPCRSPSLTQLAKGQPLPAPARGGRRRRSCPWRRGGRNHLLRTKRAPQGRCRR